MKHQHANLLAKRNNGFTLMELLITIAIIGLLSAIALPSYQSHIQKSHRQQVQQTLLSLAMAQHKQLNLTGQFSQQLAQLEQVNLQHKQRYVITMVVAQASVSLPERVRFIATAVGAQQNDSNCSVLEFDTLGQQLSFNTLGVASDHCWL